LGISDVKKLSESARTLTIDYKSITQTGWQAGAPWLWGGLDHKHYFNQHVVKFKIINQHVVKTRKLIAHPPADLIKDVVNEFEKLKSFEKVLQNEFLRIKMS